jgi:predicted polyphosphate/ATP-dependent NAD kinase
MDGLRVLVCGGRNYRDQDHVWTFLSELNAKQPIGLLIHGAATGADRLAQAWARNRLIPDREFESNWPVDGAAAGPMRNQRMIDEGKPDLIVAFPGGPGTADLMQRAKLHGVKVIEVPRHAPA